MRSTNTQSTALRVRTSQVWRQLRVLCCAILHRQEAFALPRIPLKAIHLLLKILSNLLTWSPHNVWPKTVWVRIPNATVRQQERKPSRNTDRKLFLQQFPFKLQKIKQEKQKCVRKWSEKILRKKQRKFKWKHQHNIEDIKRLYQLYQQQTDT